MKLNNNLKFTDIRHSTFVFSSGDIDFYFSTLTRKKRFIESYKIYRDKYVNSLRINEKEKQKLLLQCDIDCYVCCEKENFRIVINGIEYLKFTDIPKNVLQ